MPLPLPSVLELIFFRRGARHQLFVAYSVYGHQFVSLRITSIVELWTGWHGAWKHHGDTLDIRLQYPEEEKIRFFWFIRKGKNYNLWHDGDSLWVEAHMMTLPMTQHQLVDKADPEYVIVD